MNTNKLDVALLADVRLFIEKSLGTEYWLIVNSYNKAQDGTSNDGFYCGLIHNDNIESCIKKPEWDLHPGSGFPGCKGDYECDITYNRFAFSDCEPLVFKREYPFKKICKYEISEEFRFFHNLYHDIKKDVYIKIDPDSGDEKEVIVFEQNNTIKICLKEIKQFLAMKQCHLAVFFDYLIKQPDINITEIPEGKRKIEYRDKHLAYDVNVKYDDEHGVISWLLGKKLIPPCNKMEVDFEPYFPPQKNYTDFLIEEDATGNKSFFHVIPISYPITLEIIPMHLII